MDWPAYVRSLSALHGLDLDPARQAEVVTQVERISAMAQLLAEFPLDAEVEPAPVFRP